MKQEPHFYQIQLLSGTSVTLFAFVAYKILQTSEERRMQMKIVFAPPFFG